MAFYVNLNNRFSLGEEITPDGSIILCGAMPMHLLQRRNINGGYPHMRRRLFDPQLYMASLDVAESREYCTKLATYPWFGVANLQEYDSGMQTQASWRREASRTIDALWRGVPPNDPQVITNSVQACIDFQLNLGCQAIILPSPLTHDPGTSYAQELLWLDTGLDYIRNANQVSRDAPISIPVYATIALTDTCVRNSEPASNTLLDLILDVVSAREVDGVYIVVEQGSETDTERQCGNTNVLLSMLHLTYVFSQVAALRVAVNFIGAFGLVCRAAGAELWGSGWYKSLYRFRLADKIAGGRAYPWYWSYPTALDISLDREFDLVVTRGALPHIQDMTSASAGLLRAASEGVSSSRVPGWAYRLGNVTAAQQHYLMSAIKSEQLLVACNTDDDRRNLVEDWLNTAVESAGSIASILSSSPKTKIQHVQAWRNAFRLFRRYHNC